MRSGEVARDDRKNLAIQALAGSETVSDLAARHGVSRKFVYQQTHEARAVLDDAFSPAVPDGKVLFEVAVTKAWLRQVIIALTLICRSSYCGVVEFLRDLLGVPISMGCVHNVLQAATRQAGIINGQQDLSGIRVGLYDEIFQGATPVLAGVHAASTYCYLLAAEERRDADTWGMHLLDAAQQGLDPDYTIADAGQGLRAGQRAAWGDTPCHGDVFHIQPLLGLPLGAVAVTGLCVGYADEGVPAMVKPRLPQSVVLHLERYGSAAESGGVAVCNRALEAFSATAERSSYSWTDRVMSRMGQVAALSGRDRLRDALVRLGFPLG